MTAGWGCGSEGDEVSPTEAATTEEPKGKLGQRRQRADEGDPQRERDPQHQRREKWALAP